MRGKRRIITFGLTEVQNKIVRACVPTRNYEVIETEEPTDLVITGSVAIIIRSAAVDEKAMKLIFEFCHEIGSSGYATVFWIGAPLPPRNVYRYFKCYPTFGDFKNQLKYALMTAHNRTRKAEDIGEKFYYGVKLISCIRKSPGIGTRELAERLGISRRLVQRYITALQIAGEYVEYDPEKRGWILTGESELSFIE